MKRSPFMVTSNQGYGLNIPDLIKEYNIQVESKESKDCEGAGENNNSSKKQYDLSFQYTRESDRIGAGIEGSDSYLAKVLSEKESISSTIKQKRSSIFSNAHDSTLSCQQQGEGKLSEDKVVEILNQYSHKPKEENPLYITTSNQIGMKKPTRATFTAVRHSRSQNFSGSFNRIMFRDQGLNTSLSKSNVHDMLNT